MLINLKNTQKDLKIGLTYDNIIMNKNIKTFKYNLCIFVMHNKKGVINIKDKELSEIISVKVQDIIIKDGMKPGDKMPSESDLVELFGVSRSTIREAMKLLKAENVIEIQRGRGTFVSEHTGIRKDPLGLNFTDQFRLLENLLEARLIIEPQIAFYAAQRATEANLEVLEETINRMQRVIKTQKNDNTDLDTEFHTAIAKSSQNDVLHRVVPIINDSIMKGYDETVNNKESFQRAMKSHINIYNAIKEKDPLLAQYEAEKHIRQTLEDVKKVKI